MYMHLNQEKRRNWFIIHNWCALTGSSLTPSLRATDWYTVLKLIGMPHFFARTWRGMHEIWHTIDTHGKKYNLARSYSFIKMADSSLLENLLLAICLYCNTSNIPNPLWAVCYTARRNDKVTSNAMALEVSYTCFCPFCGSPSYPVFV